MLRWETEKDPIKLMQHYKMMLGKVLEVHTLSYDNVQICQIEKAHDALDCITFWRVKVEGKIERFDEHTSFDSLKETAQKMLLDAIAAKIKEYSGKITKLKACGDATAKGL